MAECGTPAGYDAHWRRQEPPCTACRQANAQRSRRYRKGRPAATRERDITRQKARRDALEQLAYEYADRFAELLAEQELRYGLPLPPRRLSNTASCDNRQ